MERTSSDRAAWIGALVALPLLWILALRLAWTCDDAFISFRFARHLAEGHGLVFNVGETPPVEGYSNLAWVLVAAVFERAGLDVASAMNVVSLAAATVLLVLVTRAATRLFALDAARATVVALVFAALAPVSIWATSGLETIAAALCVFGVFERLAAARNGPSVAGAALCAVLACLVRVDGAAWALLAAAGGAWVARERDPARASRAFWTTCAAIAGAVLAQLGFRYAWHDELVPNTARVKAGASLVRLERGAKYALAFALAVLPFALVPSWTLARLRTARRERVVLAALAFVAAAFAFAVWTGGDFLPMGRFFVGATPFLALLVAWNVARAPRFLAWGLALLALATAPLASFGVELAPERVRTALHFRWNDTRTLRELDMWRGASDRAREWRELGRALAATTRPGESIVLGNVGAIGYESELFVHDLFGLVSPAVARRDAPPERRSAGHDKGVEPEFFFDRRPTYLNAFLRRSGATDARLPPSWSRLIAAGRVVEDVRALDPALGFAPGLEIVLLRFRWDT